MYITKYSTQYGKLIIKTIDYQLAKKITLENHYSKKWNTSFGKINFGIFHKNKLCGVAVFGNLMNPNSYKSISDDIEFDNILELNRMWIDDCLGKNTETMFISGCFKYFKMYKPEIKVIQSFADGRLGCGTIYKASNFGYYGFEKSLFFENVETNETFHHVPLENTKRPMGFLNKNRLYLDGKMKPFYVKTYRYIYVLNKKCKIKLKQQPYPEYEKGIILSDYKQPIGILSRLFLMYDAINDNVYRDKAYKHIIELGYNENEIKKKFQHNKKMSPINGLLKSIWIMKTRKSWWKTIKIQKIT